jgi:lysozyme
MQRHDVGQHGLKLIKGFELFVPYVYDDLVPMQRQADGKHRYPEWNGGPVRGTLTIGYGHTDAARHSLKCTLGAHLTEDQAVEVLHVDLSEHIEAVNNLVKVPLTQGQFDALVSFAFNCGDTNLRRLIAPLNRGDYDACRANFGHYVRSKGNVLRGLERRRHAEQILWDDRYEEIDHHLPTDEHPAEHPAEVDERPKTPKPRHIAPTTIAIGGGGLVEGLNQLNGSLGQLKDAQSTALEIVGRMAGQPMLWIALVIVIGAAVLWLHHSREQSA